MADHRDRFGHGGELFTAKTLVSEATVEAIHEAVLPRAARLHVRSADLDSLKELSLEVLSKVMFLNE